MTKIYDQHKAAFAQVSAYAITDKRGNRVASIAFKYPRDGMGRLYCYLHVFGMEMVRGYAGGCGYDKHGAAATDAANKLLPTAKKPQAYPPGAKVIKAANAFYKALHDIGGSEWKQKIEDAGYRVYGAV